MSEQPIKPIRFELPEVTKARRLEIFCKGQEFFVWGEWQAWDRACQIEGRIIPPNEFRATTSSAARLAGLPEVDE